MSNIKVLPQLLINQIAAGECIERPSSVVKELIENSIDAGAKKIEIHIEDAGNRLIRIIDDGCGIKKEELYLAFQRHATSKIATTEDLYKLSTLGFRGEALASIASVAEVSISSATNNSNSGYVLATKNGEFREIHPIGMPQGTIVEVKNLFFNIPARRKFLKSRATEKSHIINIVTILALLSPSVSFKLLHNDKLVFNVSASNHQQRIQELLSEQSIDFIECSYKGDIQLRAYLAPPQYNKSNNKCQYCYINGRYVRDKTILRALQDVYKEYLPEKRFCIGVIFIHIEPSLIDVNVHPAKTEIRYRNAQEVYNTIYRVILRTFTQRDMTKEIPLSEEIAEQRTSYTINSHIPKKHEETSLNFNEKKQDFSSEDMSPKFEKHSLKRDYRNEQYTSPSYDQPQADIIDEQTEEDNPISQDDTCEPLLEKEKDTWAHSKPQELSTQKNFSFTDNKSVFKACSQYLQIHNSYLIVETIDGIIIVDQHALHERIIYDRLKKQVNTGKVISQKLLYPETVFLSPDEMVIFLDWQKSFKKIGFEANQLNHNQVEISSLPQILGIVPTKELLLELIDQIQKVETMHISEVLDKILEIMACKAAVKAGDMLSTEEIISLLEKRDESENPFHCPHGRPTIFKITLNEIEKHFKRR